MTNQPALLRVIRCLDVSRSPVCGLRCWLQTLCVMLALMPGVAAHAAQMADCSPATTQFSSGQDAFGVSECMSQADDAEAGAVLQFLHRGATGDTLDTYVVGQDMLDAVTSDSLLEGLKFWGGHVLTLDLPQERGGVLVIANWTGRQFAISEYAYQTGDDDSMELSWLDGAFIVQTQPEGKRRLLTTNEPVPGAFAQEAMACSKGSGQAMQALHLAIDMSDEITGVSYMGTTPAPDGTAYVCSVDVTRDDGQAEWSQENSTLLIRFNQDEVDTHDGPSDPDRLQITRKDDVYTLDLDLFAPRYCGQSARMARQIRLKKGDANCVSVQEDGS